ncbi:MAG TPA: M14 metallopeptidase family protein [Gemmatimonadaceae bacterium]|nr:M14 metallopeptidase family protein [Gemmatimonadaceae bacterium]
MTSSRPRQRGDARLGIAVAAALLLTPFTAAALAAQAPASVAGLTTPRAALGFDFGDDYQLANYQQLSAYWRTLARESDRMSLHEMGTTAEGRTQLMAIVTSPENHRNLARYKEISRRLALAEGLGEAEARAMAREGKAVIWIDGGLHATETLGAQQLGEMIWQMVSRSDPETMRILDDVIILFVHANPDGNDLVADWYMRESASERRSLAGVPRLYQRYIGHDNNRDFFASTQKETENMNRVLFHDWFPQIVYNHHQSGPRGTVLWAPPFRDPFNYNQDPLLVLGIGLVGTAMHARLAAEGKPGATMRSGASYDGWWNGGLRNTTTFHNMIGLLTETIGSPTPMQIPLVVQRQIPTGDIPFPVPPQRWHFRQSIEYSVATNRAVLDMAAKMKENFLFNIWRMGMNSIERGSTDTWTPSPKRLAEVDARMREAGGAARDSVEWAWLRRPGLRDPRGFIIPSDQPDFPTVTKFINALLETGITVHRATSGFTVAGKRYPAGSFVVKTAQAFRPHVMDMFEPQEHPDVFPYPGAPPTPPYDAAGWTFAFQMGVQFDRILDGFDGPFERIDAWNIAPAGGRIAGDAQRATGFIVRAEANDMFTIANRLQSRRAGTFRLQEPVAAGGASYEAGSLYVPAGGTSMDILSRAAGELGLVVQATTMRPPAGAVELRAPRIGLWDQYGGSMPAGWTRWIFEQFGFPFERVFAPALDAGGLADRFDVLVFVGGAIPPVGSGGGGGGFGGGGTAIPEASLPPEYRGQQGRVTAERTIPQLRRFIEDGGTVVAIGSSSLNLAQHLGLPVTSHLLDSDGSAIPRTRYYVPGSVLRARVDASRPVAHGMREYTDFYFNNSPVFRLGADAEARGVHRIAWFDSPSPLRSGWAWGQEHLDGGVVAVEATLGRGRVYLFGPEILQRAQPHPTFKLLFNAVSYSGEAGGSR